VRQYCNIDDFDVPEALRFGLQVSRAMYKNAAQQFA